MSNISIEQIVAWANDAHMILSSSDECSEEYASARAISELASELLAYRKAIAQPVAWTDAEELRDASKCGGGYLFAIGATANKFADPRRQIMLYTAPQITDSDASKNPVGEVVAWGENIPPRQGINRKVDFRWLDYDVEPGTKLYAAPQIAENAALVECKYCGGTGSFRWQQSSDYMPCPCKGCTELAMPDEPESFERKRQKIKEDMALGARTTSHRFKL